MKTSVPYHADPKVRLIANDAYMRGRPRGAERKRHRYFASPDLIAAVNVALACDMPLLLTGEAGCGKTDLAFAIADALQKDSEPLEYSVRSETRARDLLYHYDSVRRFSDAQFRDAGEVRDRAQHAAPYITLRALGQALRAEEQRVVLIDEIDKATRDLPNDLLRVLEDGRYEINELSGSEAADAESADGASLAHVMHGSGAAPLVIVTSNVERQLPEPFLRRCVFFHIEFPSPEQLADIVAEHMGDGDDAEGDDDGLRGHALGVFMALRDRQLNLAKKPATSEMLSWMTALTSVFDRPAVTQRLADTASEIEAAEGGNLLNVDWAHVPGLNCLVKLREDLERLSAVQSSPSRAD